MKYKIQEEMPLKEALKVLLPDSSGATIKQLIEEGRILVDGWILKSKTATLKPGQILSLGPRVRYLEGGIRVLYEDADLVVIDKPEGLLSVATDFEEADTAHAILKKEYRGKQVHVVHRLDQETSGVMLFALSDKGREGLKTLFFKHDLTREYIAIVERHLKPPRGEWRCYLYEDQKYRVHVTDDAETGQLAITHYNTECTSRYYTKLRLILETGRKNQIRVHCQAAGHPVVGDIKYGATGSPIKRLALHAHLLEFVHPVTNKKLSFRSQAPDSFDRLVSIKQKIPMVE